MQRESVTLYYRVGSSDKVYSAGIETKNGGFVVNFAFGRRGSTLQTGTKTPTPVSFDTAKAICDRLVREKTSKGYTPGPDGTPYRHTAMEERMTGFLPQLLNPVDENEAQRLLDDTAYWMQEKLDGKRVLLRKADGAVTGINRKGLRIAMPESIVREALALPGDFILDGECVGDHYFAFDLLTHNATDYRTKPYHERWQELATLLPKGAAMQVVATVCTRNQKREYFSRMQRDRREGAVFKRHDAAYTSGRPASGGPQLKYKFVATASVVVEKVNAGKRSVAVFVFDGKMPIPVGNVTIPQKTIIPQRGTIIEVRYLNVNPGGALYQPVYLGVRDDLDQSACTVAQLKYKADDPDRSEP